MPPGDLLTGVAFFNMSTALIYIDEAGSPDPHHAPLVSGETPLFTLAALAFPLSEWRARDRAFLRLKRQFFPDLLGRPGKRDEEYEVKGRDLTGPHQAKSERRQEFNRRVLRFIRQYDGTAFAATFLKSAAAPASSRSMYTHALQILVERISVAVAQSKTYDHALLICDSRMKGVSGHDIDVARSHMSYIFGHATGRTFTNIVEAPLFADSRLTVGLQLVDILAANLYANYHDYYLPNQSGAPDYSHARGNWPLVDALQFRSIIEVDGFPMFGYRVIDHRISGAK